MTLEQQNKNDTALADWVIKRILHDQDPFDSNVLITFTESGKDRIRETILGAFKSARRNTANQ